MTNVLTVRGLHKSYRRGVLGKPSPVLRGLDFSVPAGRVTGFLGANGAGKTTTMRCALGLDHADRGEVEFFGGPLDRGAKKRIGFLPERPYFYEHLSGTEFLEFYAQLTRPWKRAELRQRVSALLDRVDLAFAKDRALRAYSKGMLQKIGIAQALVHDPELVVLDEPMSGLDPDGRMALADIIRETAAKGTAVFFTSHLLHDTEQLCERLIVLKAGRSIYEGTTEALLDRGGVEWEIHYREGGVDRVGKVAEAARLQAELGRLAALGAPIVEVRRRRPSLEEIFVAMALRGGEGA